MRSDTREELKHMEPVSAARKKKFFRLLNEIEKLEEKKISAEHEMHSARHRQYEKETEIRELIVKDSAIQVGDKVAWERKSRQYRGVILNVTTGHSGFGNRRRLEYQYRAAIISKTGKRTGNANLTESDGVAKI